MEGHKVNANLVLLYTTCSQSLLDQKNVNNNNKPNLAESFFLVHSAALSTPTQLKHKFA